MGKRAHARLPASSSARWIACTRSALLNMQADDKGSPYAAQGTDAHALCEHLLKQALRRKSRDPTEDLTWYDQEMQECAEGYRDFVMEQLEEAKTLSPDPYVGIEQRLDYSRWIPEGFGTGDCVIIADGLLHIIDYKHGVGIPVAAENNSQLMCYAAAALDTFDGIYDMDRIKLSIYQPRRENVCTWETTKDDLLKWADEVLAPVAKLALSGEGEFCVGDHCTFCKVKDTCRARAEEEMKLMRYEFEEPELLTDEEIALILPSIDNLTSWASDVKEYALNKALSGTRFKGFKVVEGKANRKYTDENAVAVVLTEEGYDPYEKKVKGITALTKELGKKRFEELLSGLIEKPKGRPVLVPESDKRPEFVNVTIVILRQNKENNIMKNKVVSALTTVVTGKNTRCSYLCANEAKEPMGGGTPKFSGSFIIPKDDVVTYEKVKAAIQAAYEEGEGKLRGSGKNVPPLSSIKTPLRDGDTDRPEDPAYANAWFINANSTRKPKCFDAAGNEIIDGSELYSGIYAKVMINFYAYNINGNKGIAAGFQGLKKMRDGEPLGGAYITADSFGDDDDDDGFLQ